MREAGRGKYLIALLHVVDHTEDRSDRSDCRRRGIHLSPTRLSLSLPPCTVGYASLSFRAAESMWLVDNAV